MSVDSTFRIFLYGNSVDMTIGGSNVIYDGVMVIVIFDISIVG